MKRNVMRRNLTQAIKKTMGRFLAIFAIIALGTGLFVGLRSTKTAMLATGEKFMQDYNMFDFRVLSNCGWSQTEVEALAQVPGVEAAEGAISMDALIRSSTGSDGKAYKFISLPQSVNQVQLESGRMPQNENECLADCYTLDGLPLGTVLTISEENPEDTLESFAVRDLTVVGTCSTTLYINFERGSTTIGSGSLSGYIYVPAATFDTDVYTEIGLTLSQEETPYTDAYNDLLDRMAETLEDYAQPLVETRLETVRSDAQEALTEGWQEYEDGLAEYADGRQEALDQLAEGRGELARAKMQLDLGTRKLETSRQQLEDAQAQLDAGVLALEDGRMALAQQRADTYAQLTETYTTLSQSQQQVTEGQRQVESGLAQISPALTQLESGLNQLDATLQILDVGLSAARQSLDLLDQQLTLDPDNQTLLAARAELAAKIDEYTAQQQTLQSQYETYSAQYEELKAKQAELIALQATLQASQQQIEDGLQQCDNAKRQADTAFAEAEAQLDAAQITLDQSSRELENGWAELASGEAELADARAQYTKGIQTYLSGMTQAEEELSDAGQQLQEARETLLDGEADLEALGTEAALYILDRNANVGYVCFESDTNIVQGVSRVFPVFFFLVAALVCITTMTKMVEEERTEIGVLKALGYGPWAISRKYLAYSGLASLAGCVAGILVGTILLPQILWQAYGIMYSFSSRLLVVFNWPLCIGITLSYVAVMLLVTWLCCRSQLRDVPANLIRPRPPRAGKRIFLERLPFWKYIGFLGKVSIRNIFRYRKRFYMMLVGIGGCTALLVTGFGIRDSISNVVEYQFSEVTLYDIQVNFTQAQDQEAQNAFCSAMAGNTSGVKFLGSKSLELDTGSGVKP